MGGGKWSTDVYDAAVRARRAAGKADFDYDDMLKKSHPRSEWKAHDTLNPLGAKFRESRDSAEHPNSVAIGVLFDVTGSMRDIPVRLQKKLPQLLGLLLRKGYVEDPQILFGAIGDATCDAVPLQVGQFESDNRMDANLEHLVLEGGGGGHITESYELAMYFMARHTSIDCWEKRRKKGYLFLMGDETAYGKIKRAEVQALIGDGLEMDVPLMEIVNELKRMYEVFFILPSGASHGGEKQILEFWRNLFGQNVLELDDPEAVCETIALSIGLCEGTIDLSGGIDDLKDMGVKADTIKTVSAALEVVPRHNTLVKSSGTLSDLSLSDHPDTDSKTHRL